MTAIEREYGYLIARAERAGDEKLANLLREDAQLRDVTPANYILPTGSAHSSKVIVPKR